jgi:hypothetical protein
MAHICGSGFYTISVYWNDKNIENDAWIEKFSVSNKDWMV